MVDKVRPARKTSLRQGEGAILCAFVAIPVIWTSFVVSMLYCNIGLRSLILTIGAAALVGLGSGIVRELSVDREGR